MQTITEQLHEDAEQEQVVQCLLVPCVVEDDAVGQLWLFRLEEEVMVVEVITS